MNPEKTWKRKSRNRGGASKVEYFQAVGQWGKKQKQKARQWGGTLYYRKGKR